MRNFWILDERNVWHEAAIRAAERHGYTGKRISRGHCKGLDGVSFIRPHADWRVLPRNQQDYADLAATTLCIQDAEQVRLYEDKSGQFAKWGDWMPDTWRFTNVDEALWFVEQAEYPLVSKADVGSSSYNVRILYRVDEAVRHLRALFGEGVEVKHGAGCPNTRQKGYALLQRFVPHTTTYRVNAIGDARAVFFRYCYPDKPVAQTGNVEPAFELTEEVESLLDYSDRFFAHAGTKWCAIDVLNDGDEWRLIETSLAWPYPSPGRCNEGTIFRSKHKWIGMFDAMFDELERGAWAS